MSSRMFSSINNCDNEVCEIPRNVVGRIKFKIGRVSFFLGMKKNDGARFGFLLRISDLRGLSYYNSNCESQHEE